MEEKVLKNATLCLPLTKSGEVLLGLKMKKIGAGLRNGYGGGIEFGESPLDGAIRELVEEVKIQTSKEHLEKAAIIYFHNTKSDGETFICKMHVFLVKEWTGTPEETEEMKDPVYFNKDCLPFDNMMPADRTWMPLVLAGKKIVGKVKYSPFQKELLAPVEIEEVEFLSED